MATTITSIDIVGRWLQETVGTPAVKADRRIIVVRLEEDAKFCAEPPPDVAENLTKELSLAMEAQAKAPQSGREGGGKLDLNDKLLTEITAVQNRQNLAHWGQYSWGFGTENVPF